MDEMNDVEFFVAISVLRSLESKKVFWNDVSLSSVQCSQQEWADF